MVNFQTEALDWNPPSFDSLVSRLAEGEGKVSVLALSILWAGCDCVSASLSIKVQLFNTSWLKYRERYHQSLQTPITKL